jgi:hypothetical protein
MSEQPLPKRSSLARTLPTSEPSMRSVAIEPECETIRVVWGKEYFQPIQYHGIELGPFEASDFVHPGESLETAIVRVHHSLAMAARGVFPQKVAEYIAKLDHLRNATVGYR